MLTFILIVVVELFVIYKIYVGYCLKFTHKSKAILLFYELFNALAIQEITLTGNSISATHSIATFLHCYLGNTPCVVTLFAVS